MNYFYLDASALAKRYEPEAGSSVSIPKNKPFLTLISLFNWYGELL
jgi:hypothetical protein